MDEVRQPQKRGEFVPIGDIALALPGVPVNALRERAPQALHHFTRLDQVTQLVGASEADADLGFMARMLALCSLPRTDPGNRLQYERVNGPYKLGMVAGVGNRLPFGNIPRLLLAYISTEAVRTQSRVVVLGNSLSAFMHKLGIYHNSAGRGGVQTRLRNQMDRLFHATVSVIYENQQVKASMSSLVADRTELWWDPKRPDNRTLWESKIELGEKFFEEIIRHPVPLDLHILKGAQAVLPGPRSLPLADLPDVRAQEVAAVVLADALPPVRREPGQGE